MPRRRIRSLGDGLDVALAVFMAGLVLTIQWDQFRHYGDLGGSLFSLAIGLIPAVLLWHGSVASMFAVALVSLPCCLGAFIFCDGPSGNDLLHATHTWLPLLGVYGVLRGTFLAVSRSKPATPLPVAEEPPRGA